MRHIIFLLLFMWVFMSCAKDDSTHSALTVLTSPKEGSAIDLSNEEGTHEFEWNNSESKESVFILGTDAQMTEKYYLPAGNTGKVVFTTTQLITAAIQLGAEVEESTKFYWCILPVGNLHVLSSEVRMINMIVPKSDNLLEPESEFSIDLDNESQKEVIFRWKAEAAPLETEVTLVFNSIVDNSVFVMDVANTGNIALTDIQLQNVLNQLSVKPCSTGTIGWNVKNKTTDTNLSTTPNLLILKGKTALVDVRGDEVIVYKVVTIQYEDGTSQIWMAENLRTKKYPDGTSIDKSTGVFIPPYPAEKTTLYGYQYHYYVYTRLTPKGWRLPTLTEYEKLFSSAKKTQGGISVVMHQDDWASLEDRTSMNAWGIGIPASGREETAHNVTGIGANFCFWATGLGEWKCAMFDGGNTLWQPWTQGASLRYVVE